VKTTLIKLSKNRLGQSLIDVYLSEYIAQKKIAFEVAFSTISETIASQIKLKNLKEVQPVVLEAKPDEEIAIKVSGEQYALTKEQKEELIPQAQLLIDTEFRQAYNAIKAELISSVDYELSLLLDGFVRQFKQEDLNLKTSQIETIIKNLNYQTQVRERASIDAVALLNMDSLRNGQLYSLGLSDLNMVNLYQGDFRSASMALPNTSVLSSYSGLMKAQGINIAQLGS